MKRWSLTLLTVLTSAIGAQRQSRRRILDCHLRLGHADFNPAAPAQGSKVLSSVLLGFATESWGWR